ncbi:caspase family protein [Actinomadura graeca]|uniref:Caspase family protein n=1 Tax=Actinomadura graeca TaxID=2750812 RepID=A0ABX8QRZ2_9ACTN|nr:AAA domain-containing protein [Actinomadura graeca]QXJ21584.1 caspase family protein [Actinomadura graeca]
MSAPTRRRALLIGNENHEDARFAKLPSARADVWQMQQVLEHRNIGAFLEVRSAIDLTGDQMRYEIAEFLDDCGEDELALLYVSGHGARLVQAGGQFHFIAVDTDFDHVAETAVSAGFVNELLEQCAAPQKVVMIDCCRSGGFAVGLRTTDTVPPPTAKSGEAALLTSRGVYVLSSSRAGEDSYSGADRPEGPEPSVFTHEVVQALRTGKVGRDGTGEVSVADLFEYVNRRMRTTGSKQVPVHSAQGVDDRIVIAGCPLGTAPQLAPLTRTTAPGVVADGRTPRTPPNTSPRSQPRWKDLLGYYRDCVLSDVSEPPLLSVTDHRSYVCLEGAERLLSGELDEDLCIPMPAKAAPLIKAVEEGGAELWAGYPAVVLQGAAGTRHRGTTRFAPLLIRAVEPVVDGDEIRLRPYGPVLPHPQLAKEKLGEEAAEDLAATYQPSWHAGQHDRMAVDVRHLLTQEYELPCVQEPRPDALAGQIDITSPGDGARNASVLFLVPRDIVATKKLLKDLDAIEEKAGQITTTALAALSPDARERAEPPPMRAQESVRLVTPLPCNESQQKVLVSAMTHRLTVATGPPGTGKSQLVANLVATAEAAGEKVLVASTNNRAVDEVWERCEKLVPGSLVRTGSSEHKGRTEPAALQALHSVAPPECNPETARVRLTVAEEAMAAARADLARRATAERRLLEHGQARERHAAALGVAVDRLTGHVPPDLARRAEQAASARFFGEWRRARLLRRVGVPVPPAGTASACAALAGFGRAEAGWRDEMARMAAAFDDDALAAALSAAETGVQDASSALLSSTVRTSARDRRALITALIKAQAANGSDWSALAQALHAVPGWAVTCLSARRFPPNAALFDLVIIDEASQCGIPQVLPLLFRARRALIIGDVMQLPHITMVGAQREAMLRSEHGLRPEWLEKYRLAFRRHSAFHAAERATGGSLLLDEHFRCHPKIAAFANERFYGGGLNILTDVRGRPALPGRPALLWSDVPGQAERQGSSWVNRTEIGKVVDSVAYLLGQLPPDATIGVVTPFKAQADAIQRRVGRDRVRVGTVHTFQGGERDVMIFSLVAGRGMRSGTIRWAESRLNLWNVAVTRARSHLIVVGDAGLWQRRAGLGAALLASSRSEETAASEQDPDMLARLYKTLSGRHPDGTVELGLTANGHLVDAVVRTDTDSISVLLDPGAAPNTDPARHLRLILRRRDLVDTGHGRAVRLPAWRLFEH